MAKKLIVGLGNPGPEYELNRHNIGFIVVDNLACKHNIAMSKKKERCVFGSGVIQGIEVILAQPQTYMNKSGFGVAGLLNYFNIASKDLIVAHDDLDLDFGRLKIKESGGHGGHNGVRSIIEALSTNIFTRLRVGIGKPPERVPADKYVLSNFSQSNKDLDELIERCVSAIETILSQGCGVAMNKFH